MPDSLLLNVRNSWTGPATVALFGAAKSTRKVMSASDHDIVRRLDRVEQRCRPTEEQRKLESKSVRPVNKIWKYLRLRIEITRKV